MSQSKYHDTQRNCIDVNNLIKNKLLILPSKIKLLNIVKTCLIIIIINY